MDKISNNRNKITLKDWEFNRIRIQDKELFTQYIDKTEYPTNLWRLNFDYLWGISRDGRKVLWKIVDGMLVIFWLINKHLLLEFLPLGKGNPDKVVDVTHKCLAFCQNWNGKKHRKSRVEVINHLQLEFISQSTFFQNYFKTLQFGVERHIGVQELLALKGKQYANVRNMINKFKRENPNCIVRRATKNDYTSLLDLKNKWNKKSGAKYDSIWDDYFYQRIIQNFEKLEHVIIIVEIDGNLEGAITGGLSTDGQAWGCELKFNKDITGICEFLHVEFVKEINRIYPSVNLLNIGSDSRGKGGLRRFKDKFSPILDINRYELVLK
ncbi:MAG: hypothetical protein K0R71_368 [Bacillales bacterium]|jgi:hypothetical protein|nr:hypothetical protein [Bacillales bacterium]